MKRTALLIGSLAGLTGVIAGAFGAHGLREHVSPEQLQAWRTGVEYQMYHALALLLVALLKPHAAVMWLFTAGIVLFSGSLYWLTLGAPKWVGPITPIGGVCFIIGWGWLAWSAFHIEHRTSNIEH